MPSARDSRVPGASRCFLGSASTQAGIKPYSRFDTAVAATATEWRACSFNGRNGTWVFESRFPEAVQDWVGQGELRYPGRDARALTEYRKRQDSTRRAIADSLAKDRATRRIRGSVTTKKTGRPIPFAQIFVRSAP